MAVVHDDRRPLEVEQVEAARRPARARRKALQPQPHQFQRHAQPPCRRGCCQRVFHLEGHESAVHQRHAVEVCQPRLTRTVTEHDPALADRRPQPALGEMLNQHGIRRIEREVDDLSLAPLLHVDHQRIGGVEHGRAGAAPHPGDDRALHPGEAFGRVDLTEPQVIAGGDVGDDGHVARIETTALAEDAPAGRLQHGCRDRRIGQHAACARRAAAVTAVDLPTAHPDALGAGRAHGGAARRRQVREQPHHRALAVGAGNGGHRNPSVVMWRKQRVDDRRANVPWGPDRRLQVHPQSRTGIHLDHHAALRLERLCDVGGDDVDARDIEADDPRRFDGAGGHLRMDDVGHVFARSAGAEVGVLTQEHRAINGGDALRSEPLVCQHGQCHLVYPHRAERSGVITAAARVFIDAIDQLLHGGLAVADDRWRMTPRGRHDLATHHEHAVVSPRHEPLHHDGRLFLAGHVPGLLHLLAGEEINRHATALIAVAGLHHHRCADLLGHTPRIGSITHGPPFRNRDAGLGQQRAGEFLVLSDRFGDGAGAVCFRGDDPPLLGTLAQADKRPLGEPPGRNPTGRGRLHDRSRARPQLHVEQELFEPFGLCSDVKGGILNGRGDETVRRVHALDPERLLPVLDHHLVDAAGIGLPRPAIAHGRARDRLEFQRDVLEHVAHPRAGPQPFEKAAPFTDRAAVLDHRRQPGHDPVVETGQCVGRKILELPQIDPGFQDGKRSPLVRTAKNLERCDLHRERSDLHMDGLHVL